MKQKLLFKKTNVNSAKIEIVVFREMLNRIKDKYLKQRELF